MHLLFTLVHLLIDSSVEGQYVTMAKVLDCGLEVSEYGLQSRYYVQFWTNTLGMNALIPPAMG